MHVWPAFAGPPQTMRSAAYSASASAATTTDALPPSSSVPRFIPARLFRPHPTRGLPVEGDDLAVGPLRLPGGDAEGDRGPPRRDAGRLGRLARCERDRAREVILRCFHAVGDPAEDLAALPRRQLARRLERTRGACDR